jgi:hypothetical protein
MMTEILIRLLRDSLREAVSLPILEEFLDVCNLFFDTLSRLQIQFREVWPGRFSGPASFIWTPQNFEFSTNKYGFLDSLTIADQGHN